MIQEKLIHSVFLLCAIVSTIVVFMIIAFLIEGGYPIIHEWITNGFGMRWFPDIGDFGSIPLIFLTFYGGIGCTAVATVIGIPCGIYLAEFANMRIRNILKPCIEVLAGVPSVIIGMVGAALIVKAIWEATGQSQGGPGLLAVWIVVGIMSVPTVVSISEDALRTVPKDIKEASLGLGATRWQTMTNVTIPAAKSGILTAILLGMGNAIGETMAALMVVGSRLIPEITVDIFHSTQLIPAIIAAGASGEAAPGDILYSSYYALGFILFIIIAVLNLAIRASLRKGGSSGAPAQPKRK
jgi:phosphate ABC transporter permease protein PstC